MLKVREPELLTEPQTEQPWYTVYIYGQPYPYTNTTSCSVLSSLTAWGNWGWGAGDNTASGTGPQGPNDNSASGTGPQGPNDSSGAAAAHTAALEAGAQRLSSSNTAAAAAVETSALSSSSSPAAAVETSALSSSSSPAAAVAIRESGAAEARQQQPHQQ